jgi:hypothetical protein
VASACGTPTVKAPAPSAPAPGGFFERKLPVRLILASFPLLTLPLAAALIYFTDRRFLLVYMWIFGLSHFVLTPSVYLRSENLKHFAAGRRNIFLYFVVPLAILMGFYVIGVLQLRSRFPAFAVVFGVAIRLLDFNHLNRQSFGVYQLFKARTGLRPPPLLKRLENAYFACLTALLLVTFLAGGVFPLFQPGGLPALGTSIAATAPAILPLSILRIASAALSILAFGLGGFSIALLVRTCRASGRASGLAEALAYMAFQTFAALLAIVSSPLYFATLAIHYVEYHVLMFPRCFHTGLDESSSVDRWFGALRANRAVFYGVVAAASGLVMLLAQMQASPASALRANPMRYLAVVSIFDGLFVFHYFVEMLIWRFSDPFFRRTLGSLYFTPRPRPA